MTYLPHASDIERQIAIKLVDDILAAGMSISVNDGEETTVVWSPQRDEILAAMNTTDHDWLKVYSETSRNGYIGSIMLVWGNGTDLISDYSWPERLGSNGIEAVQLGASKLAERLAA